MEDERLRRPVPIVWQAVVLLASLAVLAVLSLSLLTPIPPEVRRILNIADIIICAVFLADFFILLYLHRDRRKYFLTWGWIDLISSIPLLDPLRWGRLARLMRLLRLFRGLRGSAGILRRLFLQKQETTLAAIFLLIVAVGVFSSSAILIAEEGSGGQIDTAEEALWFTLSTMTTVGYGDVYPVTTFGRAVAALTVIAGVGIFGAFTALVASFLVTSLRADASNSKLMAEMRVLSEKLDVLQAELSDKADAKPKHSEDRPRKS